MAPRFLSTLILGSAFLVLSASCSSLREGADDPAPGGTTTLPDGAVVPRIDPSRDASVAPDDGKAPLPDGAPADTSVPDARPEGGTDGLRVESITVGENVACVVFVGGTLRCWGDYRLAGGGASTSDPNAIPRRASDGGGFLTGVAEVNASYRHACARLLDGTFACWGFNNEYQLGDFTRESSPDITTTPFARTVKDSSAAGPVFKGSVNTQGIGRMSAGTFTSASIGDQGAVFTWGYSSSDTKVLGRGNPILADAITPKAVIAPFVQGSPPPSDDRLLGATHVEMARVHGCASLSTNKVVCWGDNGSGKLGVGDGATVNDGRPRYVLVPDAVALGRVSTGDTSSCAVTGLGRVRCWGQNNLGQAGTIPLGGTQPEASADVLKVAPSTVLDQVVDVGVGDGYACALTSAVAGGKVFCWGTATASVLGDGATSARSTAGAVASALAPTKVDLTGVRLLAVGDSSSCVVLGDRDVRCWGSGPIGMRGMSSAVSTIPRPVDDL
jgi:hypothetical protein